MPDQSQSQRADTPTALEVLARPAASRAPFVMGELENTLDLLRAGKPAERGELARRYAVAITEMEKVVAYFKTFILNA